MNLHQNILNNIILILFKNKINLLINLNMDYDNLEEIAQQIFTKQYGPPNSIELQLEEVTCDIALKYGIENFISNILCIITIKGVKILYGEDTNILLLTESQLNTIKMYVRSYGYDLSISNDKMDISKIKFKKYFI
jgi:predicted nucleic acid-binding protein